MAAITGLRPKSTSEMLLRLERQKLLGFFGNTGIRGYGKTPKVYFLTKGGHATLKDEGEFVGLDVGDYKPINITSRWSPQMYHRLATLDVLLSLERACMGLPEYHLPATFVEYRREKDEGRMGGGNHRFCVGRPHPGKPHRARCRVRAGKPGKRATRPVPDRGRSRHRTACDATSPRPWRKSFKHKIEQYDRYLKGGKFKARYAPWGQFSHFVLLVITDGAGRVENMRRSLSDLPKEYHQFYRFSTQEAVVENFFHGQWKGRSASDQEDYQLIKRRTAHEGRYQARGEIPRPGFQEKVSWGRPHGDLQRGRKGDHREAENRASTFILERDTPADVDEEKHESRGLAGKIMAGVMKGRDANHFHLTLNKLLKGTDTYWMTTPIEAKGYEGKLT